MADTSEKNIKKVIHETSLANAQVLIRALANERDRLAELVSFAGLGCSGCDEQATHIGEQDGYPVCDICGEEGATA